MHIARSRFSGRPRLRFVSAGLILGAFVAGTTLGPGVVAAANTAMQSVLVTNTTANPVPVSVLGTPTVGLAAGTSVTVGNLPATQPVSGTVEVGNLPATQPVSGSVSVSNLPTTQAVTGNVGITGTTVVIHRSPNVHGSGDSLLRGDNDIIPGLDTSAYRSVVIYLFTTPLATECHAFTEDPWLPGPLFDLTPAFPGQTADHRAAVVILDPAPPYLQLTCTNNASSVGQYWVMVTGRTN